jgi:hypothetical protein
VIVTVIKFEPEQSPIFSAKRRAIPVVKWDSSLLEAVVNAANDNATG